MPRVIVIGGANLDIKGRSAAAFVANTSNPGEVVQSAGGVGRNIAHNLARLGVKTQLLTALGNDAQGAQLQRETEAAGVDMALSVTVAAPTGTYLAVLDGTGEMVAAINDMRSIGLLEPSHLEQRQQALADADLLVADCNLSGACLQWLCSFAVANGKRLLVEPVSVPKIAKLAALPKPLGLYALTPNTAQLQALADTAELSVALSRLHAMGIANVVVHKGAQGAVVSTGERPAVTIAPHPVTVRDVTGAGDAAVAGFIFGIAEGRSVIEAAHLGQAAAAIKLQSADSVAHGLSRAGLLAFAGKNS
jgi:pseudouridine kinase